MVPESICAFFLFGDSRGKVITNFGPINRRGSEQLLPFATCQRDRATLYGVASLPREHRWRDDSAPPVCEPALALRISPLDRRIVDLAASKLRGMRPGFAETLSALHEATEELIRGGRVFLLTTTPNGPVFGSIISGVGIVDYSTGVQIVRAMPGERIVPIAGFGR